MARPRLLRASLALAAALAAACGAEAPASAEGAASVVTGALEEGYSGEPIARGEVVLRAHRGASGTIVATAPLDPQGRFRFGEVRWEADLSRIDLHWRPPGAGDDALEVVRQSFDDVLPIRVPRPEGEAAATIDLGRGKVWLPQRAKELFVLACTGDRPPDAVPGEGDFVVFERTSGPFELASNLHSQLARAWPSGRKGVVCITETTEKIGEYGTPGAAGNLEAYRTTWDVRVVFLTGEGTAERRFVADPPSAVDPAVHSYGLVAGNPAIQLAGWLGSIGR